jgi:hypothetical protein
VIDTPNIPVDPPTRSSAQHLSVGRLNAYQRDLSISHNKLGNLAVARGDTTTAEQHFRTGLDIRERLAAADPGNAEYQRDLSISERRESASADPEKTANIPPGRKCRIERLNMPARSNGEAAGHGCTRRVAALEREGAAPACGVMRVLLG